MKVGLQQGDAYSPCETRKAVLLKKAVFLLGFILATLQGSSQNEYSKWYFGHHAALDFMTSSPAVLNNSGMIAYEGCSSMADAAGNLLFYTNGVTVWNKQHAVMANSTGTINGNPMIIKQPGNSNVYYIFKAVRSPVAVILPVPAPVIPNGLYYSVVDMSLASGMGSVTVNDALIYTLPLYLANSGQLHAVKHANGADYWIMTHEYANTNFRAYLFSSSGISLQPVVSSLGVPHQNASYGYMKFSPTGQKLCTSTSYAGVELYDFDPNSGLLSNPLTLLSDGLEKNYRGCEFSPDGTKLYAGHSIAALPNSSRLIQWDVSAGSAMAILSSSVNIPSAALDPAALQLAPDGKIYIASAGSPSLSVINSPAAAGIACNFVMGGQPVSAAVNATLNSYSHSGLPNMLTGIATAACVTQTVSNPQSICAGSFYAIGDHTYTTAGTHIDTLQNVFACNGMVIVNTPLTVNSLPALAVNAASAICVYAPPTLTASGAYTYTWNSSTTGSQYTVPSFTTTGSMTYSVQLQGTTAAGCVSATAVSVAVLVQPCDVGFTEHHSSGAIKIYPNPASEYFELTVNHMEPLAGSNSLSVYNGLGQLIKKEEISLKDRSGTINISELAEGVYFIVLSGSGNGAFTEKLLISR